MHTNFVMTKITFIAKKTLCYFLFGIVASFIPFTVYGVYFGLIPVILCSIFLAINDVAQLDGDDFPLVFTKKLLLLFAVEVALVSLIFFMFIALMILMR